MTSTKKGSVRDKSYSPAPPSSHTPTTTLAQKPKNKSYASDGVKDNDIFLLPAMDYYIMAGMTALACAVRLFRIYQPTSVVFDEVQYVHVASLLRTL